MSLPALPDDLRAFSNIQPATMSGPLVPAEVCKRLITEAERWVPCGPGKAAGLARILVGSYPARDLSDPEIYTRAIVSVFAEAPEWAGSAAVDAITRGLKFLPTRAEVFSELSKIRARTRAIAWRAKGHLAEHRRRSDEARAASARVSAAEARSLVQGVLDHVKA